MNSRSFRHLFAGLLLLLWLPVQAGPTDDFFIAIKNDDVSTVIKLLLRGMDPNTLSQDGEPALTRSLRDGAVKVTDLLLQQANLDVNRRNTARETPVMLAAFMGRKDVVEKLIARDAELNQPGWTALHYAATSGHDDIVALLLDNSAYIDAESPNKSTPIMMAARAGHVSTINLLLREGADLSLKNDQGMTAADFAERQNQKELAEAIRARLRHDDERKRNPKPWKD